MGKEKEGVANDNLYREKLDQFIMDCWRAARPAMKDNASAYIWGNPEDLWRLWYVGGLRDSERLTFRNEIVWDKGGGFGMKSEGQRSYPITTERCLFFVLGEQGFNNNSDNYWDGWDPILSYLREEADKAGLTPNKLKEICGVGMYSHWFTKSQWTFITREHYEKLQTYYHDAFKTKYDVFKREYELFKKEYDELKKEFYATRAYFDNAHSIMGEVWAHNRVTDRWGHPTPKPVPLFSRMIKSSCRAGGLILDPFLGSGTTPVAAMMLDCRFICIDIEEKYCESAAKRCEQTRTGLSPAEQEENQQLLFDEENLNG
jgi:site-specific DNA-methyltransferase (adenine-specific)